MTRFATERRDTGKKAHGRSCPVDTARAGQRKGKRIARPLGTTRALGVALGILTGGGLIHQ